MKPPKDLNYFFAQKYFYMDPIKGYQNTLVELVILQDSKEVLPQFLMIQESNGMWGLPRTTFSLNESTNNLFLPMIRNIAEEVGYKGLKFNEFKPRFTQLANIYSFHKQAFDNIRIIQERTKHKDTIGKVYHLAIIDYKGPEKLPIEAQKGKRKIMNFKWVDKKEGIALVNSNRDLISTNPFTISGKSIESNITVFNKAIEIYDSLTQIIDKQLKLF